MKINVRNDICFVRAVLVSAMGLFLEMILYICPDWYQFLDKMKIHAETEHMINMQDAGQQSHSAGQRVTVPVLCTKHE